jgi:hypothetical protein
MTEKVQRAEITLKPVVYRMAETNKVRIQRDMVFQGNGADALTLDVYYPGDFQAGERKGAVILVVGYSDIGAQSKVGCKFKEMESLIGWARLIAACGLIAITYSNREPAGDFRDLVRYIQENAMDMGIDAGTIGLWASSGNSPLALSALMEPSSEFIKCAAFLYPFLLDLDESTVVRDASNSFKFVNACEGKSLDDLRRDVPLFVVRAGRDEFPRLNEVIDRFVSQALMKNLPVSVVNQPNGPHAFDLLQDSNFSRSAIQQTLQFLRSNLQK